MAQNKSKKKRTRGQDAQNVIRGVFGKANTRTRLTPGRPLSDLYRDGLRRALLKLRSEVPTTERTDFFNWLDTVTSGGGSRAKDALAYRPGAYLLDGPRLQLDSEIDWLKQRLAPHLSALGAFRKLALALDAAFWRDDRDAAVAILDDIEATFGLSIWLIETRLAFEQYLNGLEAQKAFLARIKKEYPFGLPAYIAHFASIRNEERSTVRLFRDDAIRRIEAAKLDPAAKIYLKYKIADAFDYTDASISAVLRAEQSQSVIDIYETAVNLFQGLVRCGREARYRDSVLAALDAWLAIDDFRIRKLRLALGADGVIDDPVYNGDAQLALLGGKLVDARNLAGKALAADPTNLWAGIESAFTLSFLKARPPLRRSPWSLTCTTLASIFARDASFESAYGALVKLCRNFRGLPTAAGLLDFAQGVVVWADDAEHSVATAALNTAVVTVADTMLAPADRRSAVADRLGPSVAPALVQLWAGHATSPQAVGAFFAASTLRRDGDDSAACAALWSQDTAGLPRSVEANVAALGIELALAQGERDLALGRIAAEAANSPAARGLLPVDRAIDDRGWDALRHLPNKLDLAIALDVLWRRTGDDLRATHLRFAFEDFLVDVGVERPSDLRPADDLPTPKLIYFLKYIAVPSVMDLAGIFDNSDALINERIQILNLLADLDPSDEGAQLEAQDIFGRKLIQDGLQIVDSNRVYVDTDSLSRWAERRYAESFERYKALAAAGIGVQEDFNAMFRRAVKSDKLGDYFEIPENEADSLLLDIIIAIEKEFLDNSEHGLHFYLGKRVRHGTVTGHLRGPLERARLVTQRKTEGGAYRQNDYWLDRLQFESPEAREEASAAFNTFASRYDGLVDSLRNDRLQIQSKEKPEGIFSIAITPIAYHVLRGSVHTDPTFSGFLKATYAVLWGLLDGPLTDARELIGKEIKREAVVLFDVLQASLRNIAVHNTAYHELSAAIREASVEVQRQFESMSEWFRRTEAEQVSHFFDLNTLMMVAIESALKTHKGFQPHIDLQVTGEIRAPSSALLIVADIVFVVLDNVCRRSQSGDHPDISVTCAFDQAKDMLLLDFVNPVGPGTNRSQVNAQLERIREKIASGDIKAGALGEGGSGLLKIAAITKKSSTGHLSFGFDGADRFRTTVSLPVITSLLQDTEAAE